MVHWQCNGLCTRRFSAVPISVFDNVLGWWNHEPILSIYTLHRWLHGFMLLVRVGSHQQGKFCMQMLFRFFSVNIIILSMCETFLQKLLLLHICIICSTCLTSWSLSLLHAWGYHFSRFHFLSKPIINFCCQLVVPASMSSFSSHSVITGTVLCQMST